MSWDVYAGRAGTQRLQIWRRGNPATGSTGCDGACSVSAAAAGERTWTLICENVVTSSSAGSVEHFELSDSDRCLFRAGDAIGWYHLGQGVTDFDGGGHDMIWCPPQGRTHPPHHGSCPPVALTCLHVAGIIQWTIRASVGW